MLKYIYGEIVEKTVNSVVISCGGLGYNVWTTEEVGKQIDYLNKASPVALWLHQAIREDSQDLYGFIKKEDRDFFELLITVSGVGPKTAMTFMNNSPVDVLRDGIASGDAVYLSKSTGIGKKSAEKLVFELSNKLEILSSSREVNKDDAETLEALKSLGYNEKDIREVLNKIEKGGTQQSRIKKAIGQLGKK